MNNPQHQQRLQKVIRYIELNLQLTLTTDELAKEACYSSFHFHRLFKACTGETVYGFRKRLVLEQAAKKLMHNSHSITDIALQAGYDNQSSFNKAFRQQYGVTPGQARLTPQALFSQPLNQANQESLMQYKVELVRLKPVEVLCARATGPYKQAAESAWGQLMPYIYSNRLIKGEIRIFGISYDDMDIIELNEAFAAQALACSRQLGLADDDKRVNPCGGAIALGHPLGMSGARLILSAAHQLQCHKKRYALCTMCIGVGQGIACVIERV